MQEVALVPDERAVQELVPAGLHHTGRYAAETMSSKAQRREARTTLELVDETGIPILYSSGKNFDRQAYACVTFPDQRWLRFLVRGTEPRNAIMTAVGQAGNRVARYRKSTGDPPWERAEAEITVHPSFDRDSRYQLEDLELGQRPLSPVEDV